VNDAREQPESSPEPSQVTGAVVGPAIQRLAAARLGRGFLPLGVLLLVGLSEMIGSRRPGAGAFLLALGALASAGAMLAYGLGAAQRAFGLPRKSWWPLATAGGLVPLVFGVYVLGWRGLRLIARWDGVPGVAAGAAFVALGLWTLVSWQRLAELETLATAMTLRNGTGPEGIGEPEDSGTEGENGA
jgi:hypothetical protein